MNTWRSQNGFTLPELIIALGVIGLLLAATVSVQQSGLQTYVIGSNRVDAQQNARVGLERMGREIREASAITTAGTHSISFTGQDGSAVTYALSANTLQRNEVAIAGGVESLSFIYRNANDATGATATSTRRVDITVRTRTEETVAQGSAGDIRLEIKTSVQLRNITI